MTKAPRLWKRFREKYPEGSRATNFFFGDHSLASARARNLHHQVELNYPQLVDKLKETDRDASSEP